MFVPLTALDGSTVPVNPWLVSYFRATYPAAGGTPGTIIVMSPSGQFVVTQTVAVVTAALNNAMVISTRRAGL